MKMKSIAALGALLAPVLAAGAARAEGGYVALNGGLVGATDYEYDSDFGAVEMEADSGYAVEAAYGSAFARGWRGELALGYRSQSEAAVKDFDSINGDGVSALTVDLNVYYDFMPEAQFTPYVGAGLGVASLSVDDGVVDDTGDALHLQLMGGASATVSPRVKLFGEARWESLNFTVESDSGDEEQDVDLSSVGFRAGVRIGF